MTPTPPRAGHDAAVLAYCRSRIELELQTDELERIHSVDCATLPTLIYDRHVRVLQDCDCDGPERLELLLRGQLAAVAFLELCASFGLELTDSMRTLLDATAAPYAGRVDFPVHP